MMCDDCIFELGLEEYDWHRPSMKTRFRCSRCQEIVPMPSVNHVLIEDKLLLLIEEKEDIMKENITISFLRFRNNCKHYTSNKYKNGGLCYFFEEGWYKRKRKKAKVYYPDICNKKECPLINGKRK